MIKQCNIKGRLSRSMLSSALEVMIPCCVPDSEPGIYVVKETRTFLGRYQIVTR